MFEKNVDARTPDGVADCEFFAPDESGQWPGVIDRQPVGGGHRHG